MKTSSSAGMQAPGLLVEARELHDQEQVVVVDVQLRALVDAGHVLQVQGMEREALAPASRSRPIPDPRRGTSAGHVPRPSRSAARPAGSCRRRPSRPGDAGAGAEEAAAWVQRTARSGPHARFEYKRADCRYRAPRDLATCQPARQPRWRRRIGAVVLTRVSTREPYRVVRRNSWVCGFRCGSSVAPATSGRLRRKTSSPRRWSDAQM